jgi:hypothetical protein
MSKIIEKIERKIGLPGIAEQIADKLSNSEISSLIMEVYANAAKKLTPPEILNHFQNNRFTFPSVVNLLSYMEYETNWLKSGEENDFKVIQLSPLAPLGTCSAVAPVDQNNIVSALRGTEIVSDATNVLALRIADEFNNEKQNKLIKYCTTHRHVRAQSFTNPLFSAHFGLFCMATGGLDTGGYSFELENVKEHIDFYLKQLSKEYDRKDIILKIELKEENAIFNNKLEMVLEDIPDEIKIEYNDQGKGNNYYQLCRFRIFLNYKGDELNLADGGFVDWTQKLLGNKKHRYLISAAGLELICKINSGIV